MGSRSVVIVGCIAVLGVFVYWLQYDSFEPESIRGKCVVITGASTGIGEQLAYQYAKQGANVLLTARREQVLKEVVSKCKSLGAQSAHYIALDMSKSSDTKLLIEEANSTLHRLDQLILNHVSYDHVGLWDGDVERLNRVMKVNFESYVTLASLALPLLEESSGSIGVVSSGAGLIGVPFEVSYATSKFALTGFFNSLRQEFILANRNISITLCILGSIITQNSIDIADKYFKPEIKSTSAVDTACAIMHGVTTRQRDVYFPWFSMRLLSLLRDWFPEGMDYLLRKTSIKDDVYEAVSS